MPFTLTGFALTTGCQPAPILAEVDATTAIAFCAQPAGIDILEEPAHIVDLAVFALADAAQLAPFGSGDDFFRLPDPLGHQVRRAQDQRRVSVQQVDHCQGDGRLAQPHLALQVGGAVLADGAGGGDGSVLLRGEQTGFGLPGQRLAGLAQAVQDGQLGFGGLQIVERLVVLQGVGGDLVAVLAHEARQRIHILDHLQPVLRERGDRGDVAVAVALDDRLRVFGIAVDDLVDHLDHPPLDQHGMPVVAGQVQRAHHARGHQHRQVALLERHGGGESDLGVDRMNQVLPGACLAHTRPAAGFHQVVGCPIQPAKGDRPAAGALQRGRQQRVDRLGRKAQRRQIALRQALDRLDLFVGGDVVLLPPGRQQQDLLEALELAVRETQDGEALVLAGQVAANVRFCYYTSPRAWLAGRDFCLPQGKLVWRGDLPASVACGE